MSQTKAELIDAKGNVAFDTNTLYVDATNNRVGVGTVTPLSALNLGDTSAESGIQLGDGADFTIKRNVASLGAQFNVGSDLNNYQFLIGGSERARIDSSGRLLVGTSSARDKFNNSSSGQDPLVQFEGAGTAAKDLYMLSLTANTNSTSSNAGVSLMLARSNGTTLNSYDLVPSGNCIGQIRFQAADGSELVEAANISAFVDGTSGANDMPGRLVFSTTADGASSPTERARITAKGHLLVGKTAEESMSTAGFETRGAGGAVGMTSATVNGDWCFAVNRLSSDGDLILLRQDTVTEGSISVSGTTVSYNGAHLSRWSQLPGGAERTEILRGTVLSNIDEMCEWSEEENEQLNRMKVSDVEGDKNVSGVFQAWDDDDDTYTNDFYCAMTGDFIIRIGAGVTVEQGDLLMSAGDGTAKPQDDDIIRSKTIAKVTSTSVSCTYDDGSYCVPCVLMAC